MFFSQSLPLTLQYVITELLSCLGECGSASDQFPDAFFALLNLPCDFGHPTSSISRNNNNTVCIGNNDIARVDTYPADADRLVYASHLNPVLAGSHPTSSGEERIAIFDRTIHIPANTVDHRSSNASYAGVLGHNIAPNGSICATTVVDDYEITYGNIVDEIANASWRVAGGHITYSESWANGDLRERNHHVHATALQLVPESLGTGD